MLVCSFTLRPCLNPELMERLVEGTKKKRVCEAIIFTVFPLQIQDTHNMGDMNEIKSNTNYAILRTQECSSRELVECVGTIVSTTYQGSYLVSEMCLTKPTGQNIKFQ